MSEVPLLEGPDRSDEDEEIYSRHIARASRAIADTFLVDEFGKPLSRYYREKTSGMRRANGALKLKKLTSRHLDMIALHLAGWSGGAIASHIGCSQVTVSLTLSDPLSQEVIQRSHEDSKQEIGALVGVAIGAVRETLLSEGSTRDQKFKAIDRLEKLSTMTGASKGERTAEDLVQELLARGATLNIISGQNVQVNSAPPAHDEKSVNEVE